MIKIKFSDFLLLPNLISFFRLILVFPIIYLFQFYPSSHLFLVLFAAFSLVLDNLDGYLARKFNQISELGKIIDPLADKILIFVYTFGLYYYSRIPMYMFLVIILRDILIIFGSLIFSKKVDAVIPSNKLGKWTAGIITFYLLINLLIIEIDNNIKMIISIITLILIILTLINYLYRAIKLINSSDRK